MHIYVLILIIRGLSLKFSIGFCFNKKEEKNKDIKSWHKKNCICKTTSIIERLDSSSFEQQSSLIWRNLDHIMATNSKTHSLLRIMVEEIIWGQGILRVGEILSSLVHIILSKNSRI